MVDMQMAILNHTDRKPLCPGRPRSTQATLRAQGKEGTNPGPWTHGLVVTQSQNPMWAPGARTKAQRLPPRASRKHR